MRKKALVFAIAAGTAFLLFAAAGNSASPPENLNKSVLTGTVKAAAKGAQEPSALPGMVYHYNARGKADPFKPFMETDPAVVGKKAAEMNLKKENKSRKALSPLQNADIRQFLLVGIAGDGNRRTGIVENKGAKKHYPLFVGTLIGQKGGRVVEILEDRVIVEEMAATDQRQTKQRQIIRIEMLLHGEQ